MTRDEEVGLYSNSTPINQNRGNWNIDKDYIVSEEGLYSYFNLTKTSQKLLHAWAVEQGIDNIVPADELHATVIYSLNDFDGYTVSPERTIFISPKTYEMKVLGPPEKPALVLSFYSEKLVNRYKEAKQLGAKFLYPNFIPHITISYDWDYRKDISQIEVPSFPIVLQNETLKDAKNITEETQPLSRLSELKSFTKRFGWNLKMTNIRDEMIFSKNGMDLFILPEPEMLKSYNSGLKGYLSGPVKSIWYQWKLVVGDKNHYGLTAIELKNTINSIVR
jgi:hypothetical protein